MEKKPEFVVTDRRKFNVDGEIKPDAVETPAEKPAAPPPQAVAQPAEPPKPEPPKAEAPKAEPAIPQESYTPPNVETGYNAEQERISFGGQKMEFIHLLDMLVQTAMMYAGAMETGTERRVDIVGLRQMVDLVSVLEQKTRGNLSEQEQAILTNTLFQLRMTYMEIVNMIDKQAMKNAPGGPGIGLK
jgi:hypothetical protein